MFLILSAALASPLLEPQFPEDRERYQKIELFAYAQAAHPLGADWSAPAMEHWSLVAHCEVSGRRQEQCELVDDALWYGILKQGEELVDYRRVAFEGTIELAYTSRGRVKRHRVSGDRSTFTTQAAEHHLQLFRAPESPPRGLSNTLGELLEKEVERALVAASEVELPRKGDLRGKSTWRGTRALTSGLLHLGEDDGRTVRYELAEPAEPTRITWTSEARQDVFMTPTYLLPGTNITSVGTAVLDPDTAQVVQLKAESTAVSSGINAPLAGPARRTVVSQPWTPEDPIKPGAFPEPTLP